jgi:hypothetical protein
MQAHCAHYARDARRASNRSSFVCLVTKICISIVSDIPDSEPKEKTKDTLGKHTMLKSDAQLRDGGHGEE